MKKELKIYNTQEGFEKSLMQHWSFKILGPILLMVVWRLAVNPFFILMWLFYVVFYGMQEAEIADETMKLSWYVDLILIYVSMWVGTMIWRKREKKLKNANLSETPLQAWYLEFVFGLIIFVSLQALLVGARLLLTS